MPPITMDQPRTLAERVRTALLDCFDPDDLRMLVADRLDVKLAWVTPDRPFEVVVFELVEWTRRSGKTCDLLAAAAERVPGKPILAVLRDECRCEVSGGQRDTPAARVNLRDAVVRFAERFRQRQRSVRLLEAYKSLHDILHELDDFQDSIDRAVAAVRGGPPGPDPEGVADQLRDWATAAAEWAKKTKRPDRHRPLVQELERNVDIVAGALTGTDPKSEAVNRAVECLANLPAARQSALNDLLIETLADFETDDLQQPLAGVLDAVRATGGTTAFEDRLTAFQAAVQAVVDRSRDHDLCQKASDVLIQAAKQTVVTPDRLTDWADVRGWLTQLAGYRPADQRAARTAESGTKFDAASTPADATKAFRRLEERFADLFYNTDKALLADTQKLVATADALSAHLDGMLK